MSRRCEFGWPCSIVVGWFLVPRTALATKPCPGGNPVGLHPLVLASPVVGVVLCWVAWKWLPRWLAWIVMPLLLLVAGAVALRYLVLPPCA